jgi:hypothetical protein
VADALRLLGERFVDIDRDGPVTYAAFRADPDDPDAGDRLRREGVASVRLFVEAFDAERSS